MDGLCTKFRFATSPKDAQDKQEKYSLCTKFRLAISSPTHKHKQDQKK